MRRFLLLLVTLSCNLTSTSDTSILLPDLKIPDLGRIKSKPPHFLGTVSDYRKYLNAMIIFARANGADFTRVPKVEEDQIESWFIKLEKTLLDTFFNAPKTKRVVVVLRVYCPNQDQKNQLSLLDSWVTASKYAETHALQTEFIELTDKQLKQVTELKHNPNLYYKVQSKRVQDPHAIGTRKVQLISILKDISQQRG